MTKQQKVGMLILGGCFGCILVTYLLSFFLPIYVLGGVCILLVLGLVYTLRIDIGLTSLIRSSYPRWVYICVSICILCIGLVKGFNHGRLFFSISLSWFVLFFSPKYWFLVVLRYLLYIGVLDIYGYIEAEHLVIPYIYKYVTIALLARISDSYI